MADVNAWTAVGAIGGPAITAVGGWWIARRKGRSEAVDAQAAMVKAAQEAAKAVIEALEARVTSLQGRVDSVETKLAEERQAWREERHRLLNDLTAAQGALRQTQQWADSLTRLLKERGIPLPGPVESVSAPVLLGEPAA